MLQIRFTRLADSDLTNIYTYTYQTWGALQAKSYTDALGEAIYRIAEEPKRPGTIDRSNLSPDSRSYLVRRHLIFYRVVEDNLEILRILHGSMDLPTRLAETMKEESS